MARGKGRKPRWRLYLVMALVLAASVAAALYWWDMRHWAPDEAAYPEQGIALPAAHAPVAFETARALGAQFVYLDIGLEEREAGRLFTDRLADAREAGLRTGAAMQFDPCRSADPQSARFARIVPRSDDLLPAVIAADKTGERCARRVSEAAVQSELTTLINQVELHTGTPVILKVGKDFEARYAISAVLARDLWLVRDRFKPRYAGRPWLLWSANAARDIEASTEPLEWVVVQP